jgi:predicted AlkP superfamily pyrophosphatase or phosphodiesterase
MWSPRVVILVIAGIWGFGAQAAPVLLISIDGLRPGDVLEAKQRGIQLPNLSRLVAEGSHAQGVVGVLPTFTLPSHATLITGVSPAKHGIVNNTQFWPKDQVAALSYNFAASIKVPTLWDAAHAKGLVTASVEWPSSLGSPAIDHNFSVWSFPGTGQPDDARYQRLLNDAPLIAALEAKLGPLHFTHRENVDEESEDARIAATLIQLYRPGLITVHFSALDEAEHKFGPGSPEAKAALEGIDTYIGQLVDVERANSPDAFVAVVSDHGFTAIRTEINLPHAFLEAGLITQDANGKVASWEAIPWPAAGTDAIYLARPDDVALQAKVLDLLTKLKADPAIGIEEIVGSDEIVKRGGFPGASFLVSFRLDATAPVRPLSQPLIAPAKQKGTHGHSASHPELRSTFIIQGPDIPRGRDLGVIDERTIAPTLARILGVDLPQAELPAINLSASKRTGS